MFTMHQLTQLRYVLWTMTRFTGKTSGVTKASPSTLYQRESATVRMLTLQVKMRILQLKVMNALSTITTDVANIRIAKRSCSVTDVEIAASILMRSSILSGVMIGEEETTLRSHITASAVRERFLSFMFYDSDFHKLYVESVIVL